LNVQLDRFDLSTSPPASPPRRWRPARWIALLSVAVAGVLAFSTTSQMDLSRAPAGTYVGGLNVSGLDRPQLVDVFRSESRAGSRTPGRQTHTQGGRVTNRRFHKRQRNRPTHPARHEGGELGEEAAVV
jgi:hypothetical protein